LHNASFYQQQTSQRATAQRAELFSSSTGTPLTPDARRRFAPPHAGSSTSSPHLDGSADADAPENPFRGGMLGASREQYALHEHTFLQGAEARLDDFLAQGREVLDNLVDQRTMLKGTQRRLRDAANTLGLSRDVVGWIDRRRYAPSPNSLSHRFSVGLIMVGVVRRTCTSSGLVPCSLSSVSI
jgi:Golgi SNAP receptor complex protein 2